MEAADLPHHSVGVLARRRRDRDVEDPGLQSSLPVTLIPHAHHKPGQAWTLVIRAFEARDSLRSVGCSRELWHSNAKLNPCRSWIVSEMCVQIRVHAHTALFAHAIVPPLCRAVCNVCRRVRVCFLFEFALLSHIFCQKNLFEKCRRFLIDRFCRYLRKH